MSPWRLASRGLVHLVLGVAVAWGATRVRAGTYDLADAGLADQEASIDRIATFVLIGALLVAAYGLARLVVGVVDIASPKRTIDGLLVRADERATADFLPRMAQHLIYRSNDSSGVSRDQQRRRWLELVVDTSEDRRTFTVRPQIFSSHRPGSMVTVHASRILGHVSKVDSLGMAPAPTAAPVHTP